MNLSTAHRVGSSTGGLLAKHDDGKLLKNELEESRLDQMCEEGRFLRALPRDTESKHFLMTLEAQIGRFIDGRWALDVYVYVPYRLGT